MNLQNRKRLTDLENKLIVAVWEGIVKDFGKVICTLLYFKCITNKNLLYSTCNSAQYNVQDCMGGGFGGEWIQVYVWLSPFTMHVKLTKFLIGYTPT